jgi:hypothetical protein
MSIIEYESGSRLACHSQPSGSSSAAVAAPATAMRIRRLRMRATTDM